MKQPQWARYESGVSSPSIELLTKICRVHACSADWLLGLKDHNDGISIQEIKAVGGSAVAIGNHTTAKVVHPSPATNCKTCPYKKLGEKLRKQGLIISGV